MCKFAINREIRDEQLLAALGKPYVTSLNGAEVPGTEKAICFGADLMECSARLARLLMAVDLCPQGTDCTVCFAPFASRSRSSQHTAVCDLHHTRASIHAHPGAGPVVAG